MSVVVRFALRPLTTRCISVCCCMGCCLFIQLSGDNSAGVVHDCAGLPANGDCSCHDSLVSTFQAALSPAYLFPGLLQTDSSFLHPPIPRLPTQQSNGRTLSTSTQTPSFLYISLFISRNFFFSLSFLKIIGSVSGSETPYTWPRMFYFFLLFHTTLIVSLSQFRTVHIWNLPRPKW